MLYQQAINFFYKKQRGWLQPMTARQAAKLASEVVIRHDQQADCRPRSVLIAELRRAPYAPPMPLVVELLVELRELFFQQLGLRAHQVQIQSVLLLLSGFVCQLRTGEGKSLAAAIAAALAACAGRRVSIYTVNDYLAERDRNDFAGCFTELNLRTEVLLESQKEADRLPLYGANVLYMAPRVAIFDRIRQQVRQQADYAGLPRWTKAPAITELDRALGDMAIVDEADALLIDEATVPFVLSEQIPLASEQLALYEEIVVLLSEVTPDQLVGEGRHQRLANEVRLQLEQKLIDHYGEEFSRAVLTNTLELGVTAFWSFVYHRDYVVVDGGIQIVDPHTGRPSPDRRWEQGLHQIVELKEGVEPTAGSRTQAMLIYPEFFASFRYLSGMSGTLQGVRRELRKNYRVGSRVLPTHRPLTLTKRVTRVASDRSEQLEWLVEQLLDCQLKGRAVLIGTASVARSLEVSAQLTASDIGHRLLNATTLADESAIISCAGEAGGITVATAMAGRGTDIKISAEVRAAGGLEVILLDRHDLVRNDQQFFGRAGRQGDPGVIGLLLSLEDSLLGSEAAKQSAKVVSNRSDATHGDLHQWQQNIDQGSMVIWFIVGLPKSWQTTAAALVMYWRQRQSARFRRKQRDNIKKEQKRLKSFYAVIGHRPLY